LKAQGILHPQLSRLLAEMGHGDQLAVVDAGFPIPIGIERVDLALEAGCPRLLDVASAIIHELSIEAYFLATEAQAACPQIVATIEGWLPAARAIWVNHDELKRRSGSVRGVIRTGEFTPYANVVLQSGVVFSRAQPPDGKLPHTATSQR
jgi:D-ribose pyranase